MSDYSNSYYELRKNEIEREKRAKVLRKRLIDEITMDNMIRIMFTDFINEKNDCDTIKIAEKYLI